MKRQQLSLFLRPEAAAPIERVRQRVDPIQHALIPAHVTLCREDEIVGMTAETLGERLKDQPVLQLGFGHAKRFDGHGILLECTAGADAFARLRQDVLDGLTARPAQPHLTLAHPRNPRAPGNALDAIDFPLPYWATLDCAMLIEQERPGVPWCIVHRYVLGGSRWAGPSA